MAHWNYEEIEIHTKITLPAPCLPVPQIPHLNSIRYISRMLITPNQKAPIDSALHPLTTIDEKLNILEAFYLGTSNSVSYLLYPGRKDPFDLLKQLYAGVRFFDFQITTRSGKLWVVCDDGAVMEGTRLFQILQDFAIFLDKEIKYPLCEKILLNFREFECPEKYLLPTLDILGDLIRRHFFGLGYAVTINESGNPLEKIHGIFIIFAPKDLDLAFGGVQFYNWGSDSLFKIEPEFNGQPQSVLTWGISESIYFSKRKIEPNKLVWLNIHDSKYKGRAGHEFHSIEDCGFLYPTVTSKFNIISFGSLTAENVKRFYSKYKYA